MKIEAKDLRIGNCVQISGEIGEVVEITQNGCLKIKTEKEYISAPIERFDTIPLTKEIFDQVSNDIDGLVNDYGLESHFCVYMGEDCEVYLFGNEGSIHLPHIKAFHQLQNIWRDLTGDQELTLKQKP